MKDTGLRVSGGHRVLELRCKCGRVFRRQARRLRTINYCRYCITHAVIKFKWWSSDKLKQAIANDDNTDQHIDSIDDIKLVLWEREDRKMNEMLETLTCNCIEN